MRLPQSVLPDSTLLENDFPRSPLSPAGSNQQPDKAMNTIKVKSLTQSLAPGRYWVGDPCYVFPKDRWTEFCNALFKEEYSGSGVMMIDGDKRFFVCGTAYGDGCYALRKNGNVVGECGVDAGLLSIVPAEYVTEWDPQELSHDDFGGVFVTLEKEAFIVASGGNFRFGPFSVNTSDEDSDEE